MSELRPNVSITAEVPEDFAAQAQRLGYTAPEMLWLLAENLCANPPARISIVRRGPALPQHALANVVPFPQPPGEASSNRQPITERPGRQNYVAGDGTLKPIPRCPPQ